MEDELRRSADARLAEALDARDLSDPRPFYRDRLRRLKEVAPAAFDEARRHFHDHVLPRAADPDLDPVEEWVDYGRFLAVRAGPGNTIDVDPDGKAAAFKPPVRPGSLVLHIPEDGREPVLVLLAPRQLSPPQRATYQLLVR